VGLAPFIGFVDECCRSVKYPEGDKSGRAQLERERAAVMEAAEECWIVAEGIKQGERHMAKEAVDTPDGRHSVIFMARSMEMMHVIGKKEDTYNKTFYGTTDRALSEEAYLAVDGNWLPMFYQHGLPAPSYINCECTTVGESVKLRAHEDMRPQEHLKGSS